MHACSLTVSADFLLRCITSLLPKPKNIVQISFFALIKRGHLNRRSFYLLLLLSRLIRPSSGCRSNLGT